MIRGISFIIPLFNGARTIAEALYSILETNFIEGDEVVVVDDASTDDSIDAVRKVQSLYPGLIKLFQHEENRGGAAARNTAVSNSCNEFIFCLDSDNVLMPNSIQFLLHCAISTSSDIASFGEVLFFRSNKKYVFKKWIFDKDQVELRDALVSGINPISSGNYLYKKSTWISVGGYPINSKALDAWSFGMRQLANGFKITILKDFGYLHRVGHESYWVRDSKSNEISQRAVEFILSNPRINLDEDSIAFLITSEGRDAWMKNGVSRPLKLVDQEHGVPGLLKIIEPKYVTFFHKVVNKLFKA
jgi:glycosyltransferase involved in cell wall biosynthesis